MPIEQRLGSRVFRAELPRLHKDEQSLRTYRLPTSRRGTYEVAPVEVPRADPFGLCRRAQALGEPQVISVHPRLLALRPLPSGVSRNLEGPSSDVSPQGSVTFHRLREYVIGDDLRKGRLKDERKWKRVLDTATRYDKAPLFVDDSSDIGILEIRAKARRLHQQTEGGLGLIIVDYLQLMRTDDPRANRVEQVKEAGIGPAGRGRVNHPW